jgi:L-ascorbate metabolism protein UlaG (beta-lactamase superfamily)
MLNITLRRKARQFSKLVKHSALTPRTGVSRKPVLAQKNQLGITFIGHSSFFLQMAGKNIVVDPNFARWLFVLKRLRQPGLRIADLPPIDAVLVTHAHFDHLHRPSLRAIARATRRKSGRRPLIIVPQHVHDIVFDLGFEDVIEMKWWEQLRLGDLSIAHTPSNHWGARIIRDMHRGFGGYVIRNAKRSVYHAGDTAFFEGFQEIGRVHTSPEDAVQAFVDLGAERMIPMHYGTFKLSHEPMDEPVRRLRADAERRGISEKVTVLEEGITRFF